MKYEHILNFVCGDVWLIAPRKMQVLLDVLNEHSPDVLAGLPKADHEPVQGPPGVAVIPIYGTIAPKMNLMTAISGGTTAHDLENAVLAAAADPKVASIVFDVDSPGGFVQGIEEASAVIREVSKDKRTVAVANHDALSAAYWLASSASRFVASPSSEVGSIGVVAVHDWMDEADSAVKHEILHIGERKADGNPYGPLSDEARASIMERMQDTYDKFVETVAANRQTTHENVMETFGKGGVVKAEKAAELGMVDDVKSLRGVLAEELSRAARKSRVDSLRRAI